MILLILLVMSLGHLGCNPSNENFLLPQTNQPGRDWKLFTFDESKFSISFPEKPQMTKQEVESQKGKVTLITYYVEQPNVSYAVTTTILPVKVDYLSRAKEILDKTRDQTVAQEKGTLLGESDIRIDRFPGREFSISTQRGVWKDRLYLAEDRIYVVFTLTKKEVLENPSFAQNQSELSKAFFDSFKLTMSGNK